MDVCRRLLSLPMIEYAEPDYLRQPQQQLPTDPLFSQQWALHNTGQLVNGRNGPADADIDWPEAMDFYSPTASVIVAVIDSGVALDHPEITNKVWVNPGEVKNGLDDDGNGYVDDLVGWDFVDDDNLPLDENGHGTLVASLIVSSVENGIGVSAARPKRRRRRGSGGSRCRGSV